MTYRTLALATAGLLTLTQAADAAPVSSHRAPAAFSIERIKLPGAGRGDYITVDREHGRVFVSHAAAVHILDLDSLKLLATLSGLVNAHGVVVDPTSGNAFVTDGGRDTVVMFDPATGMALKSIPVGKKPDAFLRDPASGKLFAFDGDGATASVVDPATQTTVATIPLPGSPEFAQADGKGMLWVNISDKSVIVAIDTRALRVAKTIPLPGCEDVTPLAFDPAERLLFAGCGNKVMKVVDADTGMIVATVPIAGDADGIAFDPARHRIVVANREGAWTIVTQQSRTHYRVERPLPVDVYAKTIALDPQTHRLFSSSADFSWPKAKGGIRPSPIPVDGTFRLIVVSER